MDNPDGEPLLIVDMRRYRNFIYGLGKADAVLLEGYPAEEKERKPIRRREERKVVLPTGVDDPQG